MLVSVSDHIVRAHTYPHTYIHKCAHNIQLANIYIRLDQPMNAVKKYEDALELIPHETQLLLGDTFSTPYIYMYIYTYTHTHTHIHICIHMYVYIYIYTYIHIYIYTYIHIYIINVLSTTNLSRVSRNLGNLT
jgi:hypothetical protein